MGVTGDVFAVIARIRRKEITPRQGIEKILASRATHGVAPLSPETQQKTLEWFERMYSQPL